MSRNTPKRRVLLLALAIGAIPFQHAIAQGKTTRLVIGFLPGGPVELVGRIISEQLGRELGQTVVVENRAGANAGIAAEYVARSAPDGQTLYLTTTGAVAIGPVLYESSPTTRCATSRLATSACRSILCAAQLD